MLRAPTVSRVEDPQAQRALDQLADAVELLQRLPILDGVLLEAVPLPGAGAVAHGLGRTPRGWFVVSTDAAATVYSHAAATDRFLFLTPSASVTLSLWVF